MERFVSSPESKKELLRPEELRHLGLFCTNDFPLQLKQDSDGVRIVPPPTPWLSLTIMTLVISAVFGGLVTFLLSRREALETWEWAIIASIGVVAIVGPLVGHLKRLAYLRNISPLLCYESATGKVSVQGGKFVTDAQNVVCVLAITMRDSESATSELQLVAEVNGERSYHLIVTSLAGEPYRPFGKLLREFGNLTGLRIAVAQQAGVLRDGPMVITEITPRHSAV